MLSWAGLSLSWPPTTHQQPRVGKCFPQTPAGQTAVIDATPILPFTSLSEFQLLLSLMSLKSLGKASLLSHWCSRVCMQLPLRLPQKEREGKSRRRHLSDFPGALHKRQSILHQRGGMCLWSLYCKPSTGRLISELLTSRPLDST
jgi:hypothetical protein